MYRSASGNVLVLTIVAVFLLMAISFTALHFTQSMSSHKVAQSACDAAALQAAKDLQRIVIDGKSGRVALVDDSPPDNNPNSKPVKGVNTLLGRLRYHALIAYNLNNGAMQSMVQKEFADVNSDISQLKETLIKASNGQSYKDKNGNMINVRQNAQEIYDKNINRGPTGQREYINIQIGTFNINGASDVPVPTPVNMASVPSSKTLMHKGKLHYKAHTPINTPSLPDDAIQFALIQEGPRLIDNKIFGLNNNTIAPDAVQVTATQKLKALVQPTNTKHSDQQPLAASYNIISSACFGGPMISEELLSAKGNLVLHLPNTGFWSNLKQYGADLSSLRTMVEDSNWQGTGTWTPKNNEVANSSTNDALSLTFAHFVRDLSMGTDMSSIVSAYNYDLRSASLANAPLIDWKTIAKYLDFMPAAWAQNWNNASNPMIPMTLVWHPPSAYIFNVQDNTVQVRRTRSNAVTLPTFGSNPEQPFFINKKVLVWQAGQPAKNSVTWGIAGQDMYANEVDNSSNSQIQPEQAPPAISKKGPRQATADVPTDGSTFTMTVVF